MKKGKLGFSKAFSAMAVAALTIVIVAALATAPVAAKPKPRPLCGPTILWECTFRDGSTELVGATLCEIGKFEKKNKATCEPATF